MPAAYYPRVTWRQEPEEENDYLFLYFFSFSLNIYIVQAEALFPGIKLNPFGKTGML